LEALPREPRDDVLAPLGLADHAVDELPGGVLGALELLEGETEVAAGLTGEEEALGRDLELGAVAGDRAGDRALVDDVLLGIAADVGGGLLLEGDHRVGAPGLDRLHRD